MTSLLACGGSNDPFYLSRSQATPPAFLIGSPVPPDQPCSQVCFSHCLIQFKSLDNLSLSLTRYPPNRRQVMDAFAGNFITFKK
ncbi:hypothetical protein TNCT_546631 [Trichonephila clavata]|uniref:Uncharacterized protein n=1 Tax=Trichonephila clavata TaxID=2740835 RepID=A0A8X6HGC7_TRICU|nr:hypothetical protein TNCT_546631 [Trichonephila clavata]